MSTKDFNLHDMTEAWMAYEEVRASGLFNMFDPNARISTGLAREEFLFVMKNYDALKAIVEGKEAKA